jgi:hypothetical protein
VVSDTYYGARTGELATALSQHPRNSFALIFVFLSDFFGFLDYLALIVDTMDGTFGHWCDCGLGISEGEHC